MKQKILIILFITAFFLTTKAQYAKLLDFSGVNAPFGSYPNGDLLFDGTFLYGMTTNGGTNDLGVIFKVQPDGIGYIKLLDFAGDTSGKYPAGSLISDGAFLYGTAGQGGANGMGTIFKIQPDGTGYSKLLDFAGTTNGKFPCGSLISDGTFLYGMTGRGGTNNDGVIYKIMPDGTGYSKLLNFAGTSNGMIPNGSLISDGTFLYGMTTNGGANSMGTIFKIKPDGTGYSKLLNFAGAANGKYPAGSLISDGTFLYGMTYQGGTNDDGVIFKIKFDGTGYLKLFDFTGTSNQSGPMGSLISDGTFMYGMTGQGGTNDMGNIFKILSDGTGYSDLFDFADTSEGRVPYGSLISNGTFLYGMTENGGVNDLGVIFKYDVVTGIDENNTKTDINVFPNPNNGQFTVKKEDQKTMDKLEIYNILGEKMYSTTNNRQQTIFDINISNYPKGIYFVKINDEEKTYTEKVVIL